MLPFLLVAIATPYFATGVELVEKEGHNDCESAENPAVPSVEGATWVAAANGTLPEGALKGGNDGNMDLYVARAEHKGAIIPGKLCTQHRCCYIAWGSKELAEASYEVLVIPNDQVSWVATSGKTIPPNAIPGGLSCECETLFVCRAPHAGTLSIGKVHPIHAVCYIPYDTGVHSYSQYEVLVKNYQVQG